MSIKEIKGNVIGLCESGFLDGMAHGCNCMHAMGSGVAGQLARRYPIVPLVDKETTVFADRAKLGSFSDACVESVIITNDVFFNVFNLYTQYAPSYDGSDVFEYDKFKHALHLLHEDLSVLSVADGEESELGPYKLGFPKIGAGLAGGDWERIRTAIIKEFNTSTEVLVYLVEWDGSDLPEVPVQHSLLEF